MVQPIAEFESQFGARRTWVWRGWRIRYTYIRSFAHPEATPLVLLHGFGSAIGQWRYNLQPLSQFHSVYALDLLGFGASQKAPEHYGSELWMAQVYEFWQTWIQQPIILVGHSLGGSVALAIADTYPEMVKGLVLFTVAPSRDELFSSKLQATAASLESVFTPGFLLRPLFSLLFYQPWLVPFVRQGLRSAYINKAFVDEELVEIIATPPQDPGAADVLCRMFQAKNKPGYTPHVGRTFSRLEMPILLLWGQQDPFFAIHRARQLVTQNSGATLVEIEDAGHCVYDEQPERVNQALLEWIRIADLG
ncbi:alpha/beta fold hydrolase [Roseofilum casamattae]|uniref:Alpha/beta fold hydrolase n=1 Tax=Roseofilum casamattae BLCC-M143 TaxID=3022442 RepID=A0ABT7C058_9CYAN|nr:alpha/beta fold hydrolase [Roseofilum casamattae]MDJ1184447.1 alpha/beta fold hydrolase [Roseofilum casamattae BLCC-M143]